MARAVGFELTREWVRAGIEGVMKHDQLKALVESKLK